MSDWVSPFDIKLIDNKWLTGTKTLEMFLSHGFVTHRDVMYSWQNVREKPGITEQMVNYMAYAGVCAKSDEMLPLWLEKKI